MEELEDSYWWFRARNEIVCATVSRFVQGGAALLDYGCGTGGIAKRLLGLGFQVIGADLSEFALSKCQSAGIPVLDLRKEWPAPESVDAILACDMLEHVKDDVDELVKLRTAVRLGGHFVATVPAYEFLWSGEDYVSEHYRRYTKSRLRRLFRCAGYEVVRCTYFNTLLFPLMAAVIMGKRVFRPREMYRSNVQAVPNWQNACLYNIFARENWLVQRVGFPLGGSILIVARRGV
jgi:SAM-dependent methyltransferase